MAYKYREVFCPFCERKFMWEEFANNMSGVEYYRDYETGETAGRAKCTSCGIYLLVKKGDIEGKIPEEYPKMKIIREYGI